MVTREKTGDLIDDLPPTSRRILEKAPFDGRYQVPYTVGRVFFLRGWGDHLGRHTGHSARSMPTSLFQLNASGLEAAETARQRSRAKLDRIIYATVHETATSEIGALLEDFSLDGLIRDAEATLARVETSGHSTAGARGYRDALVEYRDAQDRVTA